MEPKAPSLSRSPSRKAATSRGTRSLRLGLGGRAGWGTAGGGFGAQSPLPHPPERRRLFGLQGPSASARVVGPLSHPMASDPLQGPGAGSCRHPWPLFLCCCAVGRALYSIRKASSQTLPKKIGRPPGPSGAGGDRRDCCAWGRVWGFRMVGRSIASARMTALGAVPDFPRGCGGKLCVQRFPLHARLQGAVPGGRQQLLIRRPNKGPGAMGSDSDPTAQAQAEGAKKPEKSPPFGRVWEGALGSKASSRRSHRSPSPPITRPSASGTPTAKLPSPARRRGGRCACCRSRRRCRCR